MITLGINCAGKITNVGISESSTILSEINIELARKQSEELPSMVENLLKEAKKNITEIDQIALCTGPGYYTGIRAGIAYGAALAEALGIKAVALSSLELLAWDLLEAHKHVMPMLKAKRGSCYAALYSGKGKNPISEPAFMNEEAAAAILRSCPDAVLVSPDTEIFPKISAAAGKIIGKDCSSGGSCALMGEFYSSRSVLPRLIRGEYLRAPDIGACD
ncbi:MAG: tRNA (adenosine(37)-N6)-threonylcarbamoyltransferase complex dimerization subunit type 1 TsaB [Synergistes sp.]|nr:tRNA (adenosine(37)-N6)-threonylcarbamoyltransferase complex dimerization subunit type 1 TsaB [Synergistes sp.]